MIDRFIEIIGPLGEHGLPTSRRLDHVSERTQPRQDQAGQQGLQEGQGTHVRLQDVAMGRPDRRRAHTRPATRRSSVHLAQEVQMCEPVFRSAQIRWQDCICVQRIQRLKSFGIFSRQGEIAVCLDVQKNERGIDCADMKLRAQAKSILGGGTRWRAAG